MKLLTLIEVSFILLGLLGWWSYGKGNVHNGGRNFDPHSRLRSSEISEDESHRRAQSSALSRDTVSINGTYRIHSSRRLVEAASPFEARNQACKTSCAAKARDDSFTLAPFLGPCPACPATEEYCGQQCRSCCQGGASMLKMKWHGCPGNLSLASPRDFVQDCGGAKVKEATFSRPNTNAENENGVVRFVDCLCNDTMLQNFLNRNTRGDGRVIRCQLSTSTEILSETDKDARHEICIAAVAQRCNGSTALTVDFSTPLPDVVGFIMERKLNGDLKRTRSSVDSPPT